MASFAIALLLVVTDLASQQAGVFAVPEAAPHAQAVLASLTAKEFATVEAQFNDKMKAALPAGALEISWTRLIAQAGSLKQCGVTRVQPIGDLQVTVTSCEFEHGMLDGQVVFDRDGKLAGLFFRPPSATSPPYSAPSYANPESYTESELTVGSGEWALPSTLDVPVGAGPFPAVVLVHGSGPNDRDETIGPNKPFKDLALGLASLRIAVLRYDKRSKVYPAKLAALPGLTVKQEVVDDVLEAVKTLRAQPRIDAARVFVLGHSLGAMLIPRIAVADASAAGFIVMAGPARPLEQSILDQTRYLAMAGGTITPAGQTQIDDAAKLVDAVKALTQEDAKNPQRIFGAPAPYWLDLRGYDPPTAAKSVTRPLLVLQGERDYQVTMDDFAKWKAALAGKTNVTFHSYPALNHLFIAGSGKSLPSEYERLAHVSEDVIRDISDWIRR